MHRLSKLVIAATAIGMVLAGTAQAADLIVNVREVRSTQGVIALAVYDSEDGFLADDAAVASATVSPAAGGTEVVFKDLPPGTYAVAAFHDENESGKFDTNFLGIPKEGYGFSNGAKAVLGPPAFEDAAVPVESEAVTELDLSY
ncbi:MAG: DUF2141 domain-containing protein [Alphaproteobacteria bacterium]